MRSAIPYGSETLSFWQNEMAIKQRTERAMVKNACRVKPVDKKSTKDLMQMFYLNEAMEQLAKANSVHLYGHVLRKDMNYILKRALDFKEIGTRKRGRPNKT